jgi:radical SAM superfamily enzyme YgiQ (UPF0313 family)
MRSGPLKILFIDAIDPAVDIQRSIRPLGLGYLAAAVRQKFGDEMVSFHLAIEDVEETVGQLSPHIVGITSTSQNFDIARAHAAVAKAAGATVLIGGYHISMMPQCLSPDMDVGVVCEGEETFVELVSAYLEHDGLTGPEVLRNISGIVFHEGDAISETRTRAPIKPLDRLPFPDRKLLEAEDTAIMLTSRGCPYECFYCASTRFWRGVRMFSPEYVVREIVHIIEEHAVDHIVLFDDLFIVSKERVRKLAALVRSEGLHKRISFNCVARATLVDDEIASLLRSMNVQRVALGLESGSERILRYLKGKQASVEENRKAVETLARHGLETEGSFVIGAPDEAEHDMLETVRFIEKSPLDRFDVHLLTPYPGTPLWDLALERGLVSSEMRWDRLYRDFAEKPDEAIFLCERTSRERAHEIYLELMDEREVRERRLHRRKTIKAALRNPSLIPSLVSRVARRVGRKARERLET